MPVRSATRYDYMPGQLIVRVKQDAVAPHLSGAVTMSAASANRLPDTVVEPLSFLRANAGLKSVTPMFSRRRKAVMRAKTSAANRAKLAVMSSFAHSESEDLAGVTLVELSADDLTPGLLKRLSAGKTLELVERVPARWSMQSSAPDPKRNLQWGLRTIGWFDSQIPDARSVSVAVLDSGIDTTHPDLKNIDIKYSYSGLRKTDVTGHGTHVCGIIAATVNNGIGIAGIAGCKLEVWKIFPDEPAQDGEFYVDTTRYLRALREVLNSEARVLNLSLGGPSRSQVEVILFRRLSQSGVFVAAAMGNEYEEGNPISYPAAYDGVTAVGAVGADMERGAFSNTGEHIKLVAPGVGVLSTLPVRKSPFRDKTKYAVWDGTSMATPHVAGVGALLQAQFPGLTPPELEAQLISAARRLDAMGSKKFTPEYGHGLLQIPAVL